MGLLHKKLSYKLIGCFYDVQNEVGVGYDEECYHLALEERLRMDNISFQTKVEKYILHRGIKVRKFIADLIIEDKIILELKNIKTDFHQTHYVQIFSYLKIWEKDLGLLVNFGTPSVNFKRIAFTEKEPIIEENLSELNNSLSITDQKHLEDLRVVILTLTKLHKLGYSDTVYKALLHTELTFRNIPFSPQVIIPIKFAEKTIRNFELKTPIINNRIICNIIALKDDIALDIKKTRNYLKDTNLPIALLIHFGKHKLDIIGISAP